jgi:CheY-like chemotaxis protein
MLLRPFADDGRLAATRHEVRAPLAGIAGLAELLLDSPLTEDQRQLVVAIRACAEHCADVVELLGAPDAPVAASITMDLSEVLRTTVLLFRHATRTSGIALRLHVAAGVPTITRGDPVKLRQILVNLIGNAVKFTDEGSITLRAEPVADGIRFEVADTGLGLGIGLTERAGRSGSGLGLAISRQLVRDLGGTGVDAVPNDPHGTRFSFVLPMTDAAGQPADRRARPRRGRVLVADDDVVSQQVLRALVGRLGFHVDTVATAAAALEQAATGDLDALLLDLRLGGADGAAVARELRAREAARRSPRLRIVAISASTSPSDRARFLAAGVDAFLVKPIDVEVLCGLLDGPVLPHSAASL